MKNSILLLLMTVVLTQQLIGQESKTLQLATIKVLVTDFDQNLKKAETILFENISSGKTIEGITDEQGKFSIQLPSDASYQIKIKGVGHDQDYSEIVIPPFPTGQTNMVFEITIQFEPARSFTLDNVHFESGKALLKAESTLELNELFELLKLKEKMIIEIAGHTDNVGDSEHNQLLSEKRAIAVKNYLVRKGIEASRMKAKGYGENQPIADNSTQSGRKLNRRTETKILSD